MSFILAEPAGDALGREVTRNLAAAQAFNSGSLCLIDASGNIAECGADPASIAGVSEFACGADTSGFNRFAVKEFPPGKMNLIPLTNRRFSAKYVGTLPAADGGLYGVVKDTDGDWKVDFAETTNTRLKLLNRRTTSPENIPRVIVEFLTANIQII
jgi:hypothetical protein